MYVRIIPDAQILLALEPDELAGKILSLLRKRGNNAIRAQQLFLL